MDDYPIPLPATRTDEQQEDISKHLRYYAPLAAGTQIRALLDTTATLNFTLLNQSMGIPESLLVTPMPEDHIPAPGYRSNRVQQKRSFSF